MENGFREMFKPSTVNCRRPRLVRKPQIEEEILDTLEEHPEEVHVE